ncbi:MAG: flagellar export protein FliJ [Lautropia sp.]
MKPGNFALVIERHQRLRDAAVGEQARARTALDNALRTLTTLVDYRDQQYAQVRAAGRTPVAVARLALQTRFADTLDEAIGLQQLRVDEASARLETCRAEVLKQAQRLRALETIERRRAEELARRAARREQQATDEISAVRHALRATETSG